MYPFLDLTEYDTGTPLMLRLDAVTSLREHEEGGTHILMGNQEYWVNESLQDIRAGIATLAVRTNNLQTRQYVQSGISR
jgi:hypothetical protein